MIIIKKYTQNDANDWNNFVEETLQQSILFHRDYMDYHSDRFIDSSFVFLKKNKIIAVLPANRHNKTLYSHQGLTFGGLLYPSSTKTSDICEIFRQLLNYLKEKEFCKLVYKPCTTHYHISPSESDIYALSLLGDIKLTSIELTTVISNNSEKKISAIRKRGIRKANNNSLYLSYDASLLSEFYRILRALLNDKHNTEPTHTLDELRLLFDRFPDNIKLCTVLSNSVVIAGIVIYESRTTAHFQYIAASEEGKNLGALDLIFHDNIQRYKQQHKVIEFGKSTEQRGRVLNQGLLYQKESWGGDSVIMNTYEVTLS